MRGLIVYILSLLSLTVNGQSVPQKMQIKWGVCATFNISAPGDWTTINPEAEVQLGYGGGIGGELRMFWPSNWLIVSSAILNSDNLKINQIRDCKIDLTRLSVSVRETAGHSFNIRDNLKIAPLVGIEFSYILSNSADNEFSKKDFMWSPVNVSWGFGAEFILGSITVATMGYYGLINILRRSSLCYSKSLYDNKACVSVKYYF